MLHRARLAKRQGAIVVLEEVMQHFENFLVLPLMIRNLERLKARLLVLMWIEPENFNFGIRCVLAVAFCAHDDDVPEVTMPVTRQAEDVPW